MLRGTAVAAASTAVSVAAAPCSLASRSSTAVTAASRGLLPASTSDHSTLRGLHSSSAACLEQRHQTRSRGDHSDLPGRGGHSSKRGGFQGKDSGRPRRTEFDAQDKGAASSNSRPRRHGDGSSQPRRADSEHGGRFPSRGGRSQSGSAPRPNKFFQFRGPPPLAVPEQTISRIWKAQDSLDVDAAASHSAASATFGHAATSPGNGTVSVPDWVMSADADPDAEDDSPLAAGDLVECRRSGIISLAVMLDHPPAYPATDRSMVVLTRLGELDRLLDSDAVFRSRGFVNASLAEAARPIDSEEIGESAMSDESIDLATARPDIAEARALIVARLRAAEIGRQQEIKRLLPAFQREYLAVPTGSPDLKGKQAGDIPAILPDTVTSLEVALRLSQVSAPAGPAQGQRRSSDTNRTPTGRRAASTSSTSATQSSVSPVTLLAVHHLLMAHPEHFVADPKNHIVTNRFTRRGEAQLQILRQMQQWEAAEKQATIKAAASNVHLPAKAVKQGSENLKSGTPENPIAAFCRKARHIRAVRQQHLKQEGLNPFLIPGSTPTVRSMPSVAGSYDALPVADWTKDDQVVLLFLINALGQRRSLQDDLFGVLAANIVKRSGGVPKLPPNEFLGVMKGSSAPEGLRKEAESITDAVLESARHLGFASPRVLYGGAEFRNAMLGYFLVDIGVMPPWFNMQTNDGTMQAVMQSSRIFEERAALEESKQQTSETQPASGEDHVTASAPASASLVTEEPMKRRDFGNMPVYVIDDHSAHELDDGVGLEPTSDPNEYWVHVHVADPTALIGPSDAVALHAYQQGNTIYLPEARYPLLPHPTLLASADMGSLRRAKHESGAEPTQRTMTFSAKVNAKTGKTSDFAVGLSLVRNVKVRSYDDVQDLFDGRDNAGPASFTDEDRSSLRKLQEIATVLGARRIRDGMFISMTPSLRVKLDGLPLPGTVPDLSRPQLFTGFPTIDLNVEWPAAEAPGRASMSMVGELMILAGRVIGTWAKEHGVPVLYRNQGFQEPRKNTVSAERGFQDLLRSNRDPITGMVDAGTNVQMAAFMSRSKLSDQPKGHVAMGIILKSPSAADGDVLSDGGYVRGTSPLRRYGDLLVHWQIRAALLSLAQDKKADANLPWTRAMLAPEFRRFSKQDRWTREIHAESEKYWASLHIVRLLDLQAKGRTSEISEKDLALLEPAPATLTLAATRQADEFDGQTAIFSHALAVRAALEWSELEATPVLGTMVMVRPVYATVAGMQSQIVMRRV